MGEIVAGSCWKLSRGEGLELGSLDAADVKRCCGYYLINMGWNDGGSATYVLALVRLPRQWPWSFQLHTLLLELLILQLHTSQPLLKVVYVLFVV